MPSNAEAPATRLRAGRIGLWQLAATVVAVAGSLATGRGSPLGIVGGAALLYVGLLLQNLAVSLVLRGGARSGLAVGLFVLKLSLLLAVASIGLQTTLLAPMSFAVGATTLLLAIVADTCYGNRPASRPR
jgi:hypothetical protein